MILRVGPFLYRVRFVEGYIQHEAEACLGLCDNDAHEIQISTVVGEAQQIQVISHEYMEAWLFHFGANLADKEDYCDLFGMAMAQFVLDLTRQLRHWTDEDESTGDAAAPAAGPAPQVAPLAAKPHTRSAHPARATKPADTGTATRPAQPGAIATKLARRAAQVGLRVRAVYEPGQRGGG